MNPLDFVLIALATFYVAFAVSSTHGPGGAFAWLRAHLALGGLTQCLVCLSPWCAALFYALLLVAPYVTWIFAAAGASVFVWRYSGGAHI